MITHDLQQGSPEWLAYRAQHFNASDAPAMMGCSPYKTRAQLLRELHTGVVPDVDPGTQKRFDGGHRAEALARPLAEQVIGRVLYPVTGSLGRLSASFDGLTLEEDEGFEHKALNDAIRAAFVAMESLGPCDDAAACRLLPIYHRVQMEQQLHVSGAERILFMSSEWDAESNLVQKRHCWYYPDDVLRGDVLQGWAQLEKDLAAYVLPESAPAAPVGKAPETLPALRIEVTGQVTASNLAEFKATALGAIRSVNRALTTDADFADADKAVKWCADVESKLKAAKEHAQGQAASIDELFKALDDIGAEARAVRLDLEKLVKRRKDEVREHAVVAAGRALAQHVADLNGEVAPMALRPVAADFAGAIKGLRSIASMQDALDTTLAAAKITADSQARAIRANIALFKAQAEELEFLFADLGQVVHKAPDDFATLVQARVTAHRAAEAERARKAAEAEAQRIAQAEQRARAEEAARIAEQQRQQAAAAADAQRAAAAALAAVVAPPAAQQPAHPQAPRAASPAHRPAAVADEPATLSLGTICNRLGFIVRAEFVADALHVKPAKVEGNRPGLYTESQFATICRQLVSHIDAMAELYAGEPA
jgi:predicted phage-related endonuclease